MLQRNAIGENSSTLSTKETVFPRSPCFSSHKEGEDFVFGETMEEYTRPLRVPRPGEATDRPAYDSRNRFGSGGSSPPSLPTHADNSVGDAVRTRIRRCLQGVATLATSTGPDADRRQRTDKTAQFVPRL